MPPGLTMKEIIDRANIWLIAFCILSLITQLGATSLIAWKIRPTTSSEGKPFIGSEWFAVRIFVESGALYSSLSVIAIVLVAVDTDAAAVAVGMLGQICVTASYLLFVRVESWREEAHRDDLNITTDGPFDIPLSQLSRNRDLTLRRTKDNSSSQSSDAATITNMA